MGAIGQPLVDALANAVARGYTPVGPPGINTCGLKCLGNSPCQLDIIKSIAKKCFWMWLVLSRFSLRRHRFRPVLFGARKMFVNKRYQLLRTFDLNLQVRQR